MKKCSLFLIGLMSLTMLSFSQTVKENIEKQAKDPKTVDNAAKADVYIVRDQKKITEAPASPCRTNQNPAAKKSRKKKTGRKN